MLTITDKIFVVICRFLLCIIVAVHYSHSLFNVTVFGICCRFLSAIWLSIYNVWYTNTTRATLYKKHILDMAGCISTCNTFSHLKTKSPEWPKKFNNCMKSYLLNLILISVTKCLRDASIKHMLPWNCSKIRGQMIHIKCVAKLMKNLTEKSAWTFASPFKSWWHCLWYKVNEGYLIAMLFIIPLPF